MTTPAAVVMLPVWQRQSSDWPVLNWQRFRQLWPSCVRPEGGHLLQICCSVDAVAATYCPALVVALASWKVVDQSFCSLSALSFTSGCSLIARYVAMGRHPLQQSLRSQQREVMVDDGLFSSSAFLVWRASSMDRQSVDGQAVSREDEQGFSREVHIANKCEEGLGGCRQSCWMPSCLKRQLAGAEIQATTEQRRGGDNFYTCWFFCTLFPLIHW